MFNDYEIQVSLVYMFIKQEQKNGGKQLLEYFMIRS